MKWIVIASALLVSSLVSSLGHAAGSPEMKEYKTHFENPVVDERIAFTTCAVGGALLGMLTGEPGDVVCWGSLVGDRAKDATVYWVFKSAKRKTQDYFEQIAYKNLGGISRDGSGGTQDSSVQLRSLNAKLEKPEGARLSTLTFHTEWTYSEDSTWLRGKLPGATVNVDAPVFDLSEVDQEMKKFAGELAH